MTSWSRIDRVLTIAATPFVGAAFVSLLSVHVFVGPRRAEDAAELLSWASGVYAAVLVLVRLAKLFESEETRRDST